MEIALAETTTATSDLLRIVHINEGIKEVAGCATSINIVALNAIVRAAQAGDAARGFGQVSIEIRAFSSSLKTCMYNITQLTNSAVDAVTSRLKTSRLHDILRRATNDPVGAAHLSVAMRNTTAGMAACDERLQAQRDSLATELTEAGRLSNLGQALSRSARIEAAYGGEYAEPLVHLTDEFASVITRITISLRRVTQLACG